MDKKYKVEEAYIVYDENDMIVGVHPTEAEAQAEADELNEQFELDN